MGVRTVLLSRSSVMSVVSYWEVVIKSIKGTLDVGDPAAWWNDALEQLGAVPLALRPEHVKELSRLPPFHKDPFDRMLIAQAIAENLHLVTVDAVIQLYGSDRLTIVF